MATTASIGMVLDDGSIKAIFCNFDGYLEHVGKTLEEDYNDRELVMELIEQGDMSFLDRDVESSVFYARDRDESWEDNKPQEFEGFGDYYCNFVRTYNYDYLFDKVWMMYDYKACEFIPISELI